MSDPGALVSRAKQEVWNGFCRSGDPLLLCDLPEVIAGSWQRCFQHGVDPNLPGLPYQPDFQISPDPRMSCVVEAAASVLEKAASDLGGDEVVALVADKAARLVYRHGSPAALKRIEEKCNTRIGAMVAENVVGTNACGTTLLLGEPVSVDLYEHFCATFFEWTDTAVPLFASDHREILGALDLALYRRPISAELRALARSIGREIQSQLREQDATLRLALLRRFAELADKYSTNGLVAFDQYGYVVAHNSAAERQLSLPRSQSLGVRADKIPGVIDLLGPQASDLFRPSSSQRSSVHSQLVPVTANRFAGNILLLSVPAKTKAATAWPTRYTFSDLIGNNPEFSRCLDLAAKASQQSCPLFIFGESGTGKELFAQAIHHASPRRDQNFVAFSCAGIGDDLIAAELFGYVEGSFTGAAKGGAVGKVQLADKGTLFLDDVDAMSARMQASLLRVIEDQQVVPIGSAKPRSVDVRIIAASNIDLDYASRDGQFRRDLYFRLNVLSILLPPLRERRDDLPTLIKYLIDQVAPGFVVDPEALAILLQHDWPGNLRELRNVLVQASAHASNNEIKPADLRQLSRQEHYSLSGGRMPDSVSKCLKATELEAISEALRTSKSTLEAAEKLGIHFTTLYRKLRKYDLRSVESRRS